MTIIKIPSVNDSYTGHVKLAEKVAGKFGAQVAFHFVNGDQLFMPETSAMNQLVRAGFDGGGNPPTADLEAVAGNTLCFSRSPNKTPGASPYYNITVATGAAPAPSKRIAGPTTGAGPQQPVHDRWKDVPETDTPDPIDFPVRGSKGQGEPKAPSWDTLVQQMGVAYIAAVDIQGEKGTAESYQAMTATLIIAADKRGITIPTLTQQQVVKALDLEEPPF